MPLSYPKSAVLLLVSIFISRTSLTIELQNKASVVARFVSHLSFGMNMLATWINVSMRSHLRLRRVYVFLFYFVSSVLFYKHADKSDCQVIKWSGALNKIGLA